MSTRAVVLAAGQGTRMKSDLAKVLHQIAGKPLVNWVLDALRGAGVDDVVVVVGYQADEVRAVLPAHTRTAYQADQLGTAHAAAIGLEELAAEPDDTIVVLLGDMPLLTVDTIQELVSLHEASGTAATLVSVELEDPTGYGRILREDGRVVGIVEQRDATPEQLGIREVNPSVYAFRAEALGAMLERVRSDNSQGEHYLTDVIGLLVEAGHPVAAIAAEPEEGLGVNSHDQLAEAAGIIRRRLNAEWMRRGVWMLDPERVYLDAGVVVDPGVRLYPDSILEGETRVGEGAEIGPAVHARNSVIGPGARVRYAVLDAAVVGEGADVGPFASLRPGSVLGSDARAGTFVELKQTTLGSRSKVPHLSYLGDATVGTDSNVGAGTITCNWDGYVKNPTTIGDRVLIGSDTMLVAPVEIGDDALTAAGSVITRDVPPGALGVERSHQREIPGYAARRKRRTEKRD